MHRKLKNVLSGLAMAFVAVMGGVMFGEPASPAVPRDTPAHVLPSIHLAVTAPATAPAPGDLHLRVHGTTIRVHMDIGASDIGTAHDTTPEPVPSRAAAPFQMPYFSFGAMLPRVQAES